MPCAKRRPESPSIVTSLSADDGDGPGTMRRHGSKIRWLRVAHALLTAFVLGFLPLSLHAAGEEDRVLMLPSSTDKTIISG